MRVSFSALNRIVETQAAELRLVGKPAPVGKGPKLSDARLLTDQQLLERLREVGVEMDRAQLQLLVQRHCSAEEIAKGFLKDWRPKPGQGKWVSDWIWIALTVLWQRWFPEIPNFERVDDDMQRGYALEDQPAQCEVWIRVWKDIGQLREKIQTRSMNELDGRFGGTQSLFNWIQDLEMGLANAAADDPRFHEERARICSEFLSDLEESDPLITENMRRAWAESVHALGDETRSESMFREWLAADPDWGWGWIALADLYFLSRNVSKADLERAEAILKEGVEHPEVRNRKYMLERLASIYREQGRTDEALELDRLAASTPSDFPSTDERLGITQSLPPDLAEILAREGRELSGAGNWVGDKPIPFTNPPKAKVGRNDPCPCGSQKKYKRCCGA
jgi:tetratricopeptide (TPR) repeat protein